MSSNIKNFYLPFIPFAKVNYYYILSIYECAEFNTLTKTYDKIKYNSMKELSKQLNISYSNFNRIINNVDYQKFFVIDSSINTISLCNHFFNQDYATNPFVIISRSDKNFLEDYHDNFLCKYFIYIKHYCSISKNNNTIFTMNQFFESCGYSTNSASYKNKISQYNKLFKKTNIISVFSFYDSKGHKHNRYQYNGNYSRDLETEEKGQSVGDPKLLNDSSSEFSY